MRKAIGIDISKWDVSYDPGPETTPDFVILRAFYGPWKDPKFDYLMPGVLRTPVRGAYHYLRSDYHWEQQADLFINVVKDLDLHFFVCDFETLYNSMSPTFVAMAMEWMAKVKRVTGKPVLLYTNTSTYDSWIWRYDRYRAAQYPLWIAQYPYFTPDPQTSTPNLPKYRSDWKIWQYSPGEKNSEGIKFGVGRRGVDVNVYNGSFEDMVKFFGVNAPPPIEEPLPEIPVVVFPVTVKVANKSSMGVNVRKSPSLMGSPIGWEWNGANITILQAVRDASGNVWARTSRGYICMFLVSSGNYFTEITSLDNITIDDVPAAPEGMFFRLRHDVENPKWNYKARQLHPDWTHDRKSVGYPQTFPVFGGNGIVNLTNEWVRFFDSINTAKVYDYIRTFDMGWYNKGVWPQVRQLSWGGNVVEVSHIEGNRAYLKNYYYNNEAPPDVSKPFYDSTIIHYFSVVYPDGSVGSPPVGPLRTFIIANNRDEKLYVPLDQIIQVPGPAVYIP